jgi:large subunit ribosomal protein L4
MLSLKLLSSCQQILAKNFSKHEKVVLRLYTGTSGNLEARGSDYPEGNNQMDLFNSLHKFDINEYRTQYGKPQESWVQSLNSIQGERLKIKSLHQDVFAVYPRIDIIHENVKWQRSYSRIDYNHVKNVKEMIHYYGGGAKPWPQKGTGRARHGSTRSPQWVDGGKVFGPKAPKSHYYMLPLHQRVYGLTHTLTIKFIQDDIHIVDNLEIPTDDPQYILDLIKSRGWGKSTLFVDSSDIFPTNITAATDDIQHVNLMPVYGLNVISMLKHETLVLTESALEDLTRKLIFAVNRTDIIKRNAFNKSGPKELQLNLEQYRPLV